MNKRIPQKLEQRIEEDPRVGLQVQLELLHNKNQLLPRLRREFTTAKEHGGPDYVAYMTARGIHVELGLDLLVQLVLHKRASVSTMVGILRRHAVDHGGDSKSAPPVWTLQDVADQVLLCCQHDLCDFLPASSQLVVRHDVTPDVQEELDRFQFPLPMVVQPRELRRNTDSAFLLTGDGGGSVILRNNHHDDDVCLDHLNRMNRIRFSIDHETATMVRNQWRNLDKPKPGETRQDFERRVRAFEKYDRTAHDVINLLISEGNSFYLTHKVDKRGRTYCQGYAVNYQGNAWNKAVVQLADKEIVP